MKTPTEMDPAPVLGMPLPDPIPPADCGWCATLVKERAEARARDDGSRVSDLNIEIRHCDHEPPRRRKQR
ncbi:hypothetical protein [Streptomyces sp. AMCC400023]|uniref:hypothetical protein n=1 Tax=Streptomyces sp. AMCC400023 TaxID=2056258 RepID=UPI001F31666E|nr:hypothetical protein [Streptomyces sp. AMCC400023]UJV43797.1 hypothetical protein CVT30_31750 [Streptomyces sp. AMCC400023]